MLEFYDSFNSGHLVDIGSLAGVGSLANGGWLTVVGSLAGCVGNLLDAASSSSVGRIAISLAGSSSNIHLD